MAPRKKSNDDRFAFPLPFVEWKLVLHALDPVRDATRSWARSLRAGGELSPGVTVTRQSPQGLASRATYNSALWMWAERCQLAGFANDAYALRDAARALELRFAEPLIEFLAGHELHELPEAPFFDELAFATADALGRQPCFTQIVLAAGQVERVDADFGHVRGHGPDGHPAVVDLPARMLTMRGVQPGASVWVVSRMLGDAALVEVDLAVPVPLPAPVSSWFEWTRLSASESAWELDLTLADESDAAAAARYETTAALLPRPDYWDDLFEEANAGRLPVRHLHPVG